MGLTFVKRSRESKGFIIFVFGSSAGNICCRCLLNHGGSRRERQSCRPKGLQFEAKSGKANKADTRLTTKQIKTPLGCRHTAAVLCRTVLRKTQKETASIDAHTAKIED